MATMNGATSGNGSESSAGPATIESSEGIGESLFAILWRRRWIVLLAGILALGGGFLYLQQATPLYTSTSRICVEQTGPQVFERDNSGIITRWDNYLYTQAERLKSTDVLSAALKSPELANLQTLATASNPIAALRRRLEVQVGKKDEIINISFLSPYPDEAAAIVNTIVDAYITSHDQRKRSTIGEVVRILKEEKAKRSQELITKLTKMMEFKQQNEGLAFGADQDNNIIVRRLERLSAALTEAQLATAETKSLHEATRKMADKPSGLRRFVEAQRARGVYISTMDDVSSLQAELSRLERGKADSLRQLKPDHPGVLALDAEIDRVRKKLAELDGQFAEGQLEVSEQQYVTAQEKEQELERYFEQQRQQAISLNNQLAQFTILQSDYEQTNQLCDLLDNSIQRLDVTTEVGALNIAILESAAPALTTSEPQKAKVMALALCLGLFAGTGLALLREWKDQRLHSTDEISALLNLPILGMIPAMTSPKQTPAIRGQKVRISPDSREAEAFRTVRTAVFFGAPKEEAKTIVITSPAPGEGKSTVAANLGIAMAQAGQRVLILDADLRRPIQHRIFTLDRKTKGLSLVLAGEMVLDNAIEHTGMGNLDVLTCGPDVSNPAEMLNSEKFRRVVEELAGKYDRVLIDSPPVIAVTDALIVAARCDVTLLVLRAEASTRRVSVQAREGLASVDAKVLGVVVNDVPRRGGRYGYYSGYGYYYYYGSDGNRRKRRKAEKEATSMMTGVGSQSSRTDAQSGEIDEATRRSHIDGVR
jgi:succinoglycan biosynthesis transport protein ExoP